MLTPARAVESNSDIEVAHIQKDACPCTRTGGLAIYRPVCPALLWEPTMNRLSECHYWFVLVDLLCHSPSDQLTTELAAERGGS